MTKQMTAFDMWLKRDLQARNAVSDPPTSDMLAILDMLAGPDGRPRS